MGAVGSRQEQFWEACSFGRIWLVQKFIEEGIDVNWVSHVHDSCPIHVASQGKIEVVRLLLQQNCNVNALDNKDNTALHHAAMSGDTEVCQLLIDNNARIDATNKYGWTPLINAAYWCNYSALECLLNNKAMISCKNKEGRAVIHELCRSKSTNEKLLLKCLTLLIDYDADINEKTDNPVIWDSEADFSPLLFAVYHGHVELVECLLECGADINVCDRNGWSALHWAAERGHGEIVKLLIISGIQTEMRTYRGELPIEVSTNPAIKQLIDPNTVAGYPQIVSNGYVTTDDELSDIEEHNDDTDDMEGYQDKLSSNHGSTNRKIHQGKGDNANNGDGLSGEKHIVSNNNETSLEKTVKVTEI